MRERSGLSIHRACALLGFTKQAYYKSHKRIRKCHARQTLCIMHAISRFHISLIRSNQILMYHLNCMQSQRIRKITM